MSTLHNENYVKDKIFKVWGKVLVKESSVGISNLIVSIVDVDNFEIDPSHANKKSYQRIGSTITDDDGSFELLFDRSVFITDDSREGKPDLTLVVSTPNEMMENNEFEENYLFYNQGAIRKNAGYEEAYIIKIKQDALKEYDVPFEEVEDFAEFKESSPEELAKKLENRRKQVSLYGDVLKIDLIEAQTLNTIVKNNVDTAFKKFSISPTFQNKTLYIDPRIYKQPLIIIEKNKNILKERLKQWDVLKNKNFFCLLDSQIEKNKWLKDAIDSHSTNNNFELKISSEQYQDLIGKPSNTSIESGKGKYDIDLLECHKNDDSNLGGYTPPSSNPDNDTETNFSSIQIKKLFKTDSLSQYVSPRNDDLVNNGERINQSLPTFELKGGPADATAFYDFIELKLALPHVWSSAYSGKLEELGKKLYETIVKTTNNENIEEVNDPRKYKVEIKTVDDMKNMYKNYKDTILYDTDIPYHVKLILKSSEKLMLWRTLSKNNQDIVTVLCWELKQYREKNRNIFSTNIIPKNILSEMEEEIFTFLDKENSKSGSTLDDIFKDLDEALAEGYKFDIFAPDSVNFGLLVNYRQKWEPEAYQVGELVKTLPLAPKESRKYTTKTTRKLHKSEKQNEDYSTSSTFDTTSKSRIEAEAISKATAKNSFEANAKASSSWGVSSAEAGMKLGIDSSRESQDTKKNFRESVMKSLQNIKNQRKLQVETKTDIDFESSESGEIYNPNEEITVTYLFYELQRRFQVSEKLHKVTNVIYVANEVPAPDEIDHDWIMRYSWILKRIILDDDFLDIFHLLENSYVGKQLSVETLQENYLLQLDILKEKKQALASIQKRADDLHKLLMLVSDGPISKFDKKTAIKDLPLETYVKYSFSINPFQGHVSAKKMTRPDAPDEEATQEEFDRMGSIIKEDEAEISLLMNSLDKAKNDYLTALQEKFNEETEITRLRLHIKDNILYYMQGIWDYEPADQRYFRLYDIDVSWPKQSDEKKNSLKITKMTHSTTDDCKYTYKYTPDKTLSVGSKKLGEIANLDNILGYKGNYMIFPVNESNDIHDEMMLDYIDTETGYAKDPDELGNYNLEEIKKYAKCLSDTKPSLYDKEKDELNKLISKLEVSNKNSSERVIVPTDSLFIEALPGSHPLLEGFKLQHRALDVKKVEAEVRGEELENIRKAARILDKDLGDPDIEKIVRVEGNGDVKVGN